MTSRCAFALARLLNLALNRLLFSLSPIGGENSPNDGSRFEPMNRGDLVRKTSEDSPSPIGWERAGVRVHGEGRGEGALPFKAPPRVKDLTSSIPMTGLLFSLSHRMGEGWGEGALPFMASKRAILFGGIFALLTAFAPPLAAATTPARPATIDEIAAGIEKHIAQQSKASGGYFKLRHNQKELSLQLVRVHLEYLAALGQGVSFACVDLVGTDGPVYDVDFFMKGPPGAMTVTETTVHKVNGRPLYAWEQESDGTWRRVPVKNAPRHLLGVINGADEFDFMYRAKLPEITGPARLWLPLAASDMFQRVEVKSINLPPWRELDEREHGNKVLFLEPGPADSGKSLEIRYRVKRFEKAEYAVREAITREYLKPENLVPTNETFRALAQQLTRGKTNELTRARALYDYVMDKVRYAKYGPGWGRGDAVYACDARSGNCTDFHALFIALARAADIPARFAIGVAIPSERNEGGIDGYHCWAEFFADGKWVPVDISEANKIASLSDYYFGHHPANRFEFSKGRDLVVEPGPAAGPINFLAYPVMEMGGKPIKVQTEFVFRRP